MDSLDIFYISMKTENVFVYVMLHQLQNFETQFFRAEIDVEIICRYMCIKSLIINILNH